MQILGSRDAMHGQLVADASASIRRQSGRGTSLLGDHAAAPKPLSKSADVGVGDDAVAWDERMNATEAARDDDEDDVVMVKEVSAMGV